MENIKIVEKYYTSLWVNKNINAINEYCDSDFILRSPNKGVITGITAARRHIQEWFDEFPNLIFEVNQISQEETDIHCTWDAYADSSKVIHMTGTSIFKIQDNKIIEYTAEIN